MMDYGKYATLRKTELMREAENERLAKLAAGGGRVESVREQIGARLMKLGAQLTVERPAANACSRRVYSGYGRATVTIEVCA